MAPTARLVTIKVFADHGVEMITDHAGWTGYHVNLRSHPDPSTAPATELVVALDGGFFAERSLEAADALAAASGLPLRLVTVRPTPADLPSAESYLARVARRAPRVSDLTVEIDSDVATSLAAAAAGGALVVMATHARRAVGEVLFGSVADEVLRAADRPVLLVGPNAGVPDPTFSTIVLPEDGGPGGRRLRPHAQAWSEHLAAVAWVIQVVSIPADIPRTDVLEAAHVKRVATSLGRSAEWEVLRSADPAAQIVDFAADRRSGLIALSIPARHRVGPDVAGGVALQVVRHAPCPVLALGQER